MVLPQTFFNRPTLRVARDLLGKFVVRKNGTKIISAMITEVEAYCGPRDKASHASRGRTPRTYVMFGPPGTWYVYLIYGMYFCLNIVTEKEGYPAAILIRGVEGVTGPGRVCRFFNIDKKINALPANKKTGFWIEERCLGVPARSKVKRATRIGVDYAGAWKDKKWRFTLKTPFSL